MNRAEIEQLDKCIEMLLAGATLDECIRYYPEINQEVLTNLKLASETLKLGEFQVTAEILNKNQQTLLEKARVYREKDRLKSSETKNDSWLASLFRRASLSPKPMVLAGRILLVLVITGMLIAFSRGLVITSAKSLPGDSLYPIKRVVEDIRIYLTTNQVNKQTYEEDYNLERVGEIVELLETKRVQQVSFEGILEVMTDDLWIITGIPVNIKSDTTMQDFQNAGGKFIIGSEVEVEGFTNGVGSVDAEEIHLRQFQVEGIVEKIDPNNWQISGLIIPIDHGTYIEEGITVGDRVIALIHSEDGGFYGTYIQSKNLSTASPTIQSPQISTPFPSETTSVNETKTSEPEETVSVGETENPDTYEEEDVTEKPVETNEDKQISTPVPPSTEEHESEDGSGTPEHQDSPDPTETHEGEP